MRNHRIIESERIYYRAFTTNDAKLIFELDSNPLVHRYLGNKPLKTMVEAQSVIDLLLDQYENHGIGRWAMIDKATGSFIGWNGLKFVTEEINGRSNYYDLGYRLLPEFWGKGFATEGARTWLNYAKDELQLKELFAAAHVDNIASNRIIQNLGFDLLNRAVFADVDHNWYKKSL